MFRKYHFSWPFTGMLFLFILNLQSCSSKKQEEAQRQEEEATPVTMTSEEVQGNFWNIDIDKYACTKLPGSIRDITTNYEATSGQQCKVKLLDNTAGKIRMFDCGQMNWAVASDEATCQDAISRWRQRPNASTWVLTPGGAECRHLDTNLGELIASYESDGKECDVRISDPGEPGGDSIKMVECGEVLFGVTHDQASCEQFAREFAQYRKK